MSRRHDIALVPSTPESLTRREREVVAQLASGRTNRAIAQELVIAVSTVERHVANILSKLGLQSRAEVTIWALQRDLTTSDSLTTPTLGPAAVSRASGTNLPYQITTFVGRQNQIQKVSRLLDRMRMVTLVGPGGIGKTRLALRVAETTCADYTDGAWLVDLAPIGDEALVDAVVAATLNLPQQLGRQPREVLLDALHSRSLLLVLDNCEHLVAHCATLARDVLQACPFVRILATSREPLGVSGEVCSTVPLLDLPADNLGLELLSRVEAIQLFVDRAIAADPEFALTEQVAPAVIQVCRQVEGLPLAVELAAARARFLSTDDIAERVGQQLRFLTTGTRTAPARHHTLRATVMWSYTLLSPLEQRLFRRLAVFSGGWTVDEAESICADDDDLSRADVVDVLGQLVQKSLVSTTRRGTHLRYRLLSAIRELACEQLGASGEDRTYLKRHCAWYLTLCEAAAAHQNGPEQAEWFDRVGDRIDEIRGALEWSLHQPEEVHVSLRMCGALRKFWALRGHMHEGRAFTRRALELAGQMPATPEGVHALVAAIHLARQSGDPNTVTLALETVRLARSVGDADSLSRALEVAGSAVAARGEYRYAEVLLSEAISVVRSGADPTAATAATVVLAGIKLTEGERLHAARLLQEADVAARARGAGHSLATVLMWLAFTEWLEGRTQRTSERLVEAIELLLPLHDHPCGVSCLRITGCSVASRAPSLAARWLAAADAGAVAFGTHQANWLLQAMKVYGPTVTSVYGLLGSEGFTEAWKRGQALSVDQALEEALVELRRVRSQVLVDLET